MSHVLDPLFFIGLALSVVGSVYVAYLSFDIYRYNRLNKAWLAMTLGFLLVILHQFFVFGYESEWLSHVGEEILNGWTLITMLTFIGLWIFGFWHMRKSFAQFKVMGEQADEKLAAFTTTTRRKRR